MMLNIVLVLAGIASLLYGIKAKVKFFTIAGIVLCGFGMVSAIVDLTLGADATNATNSRLPFVINRVMR